MLLEIRGQKKRERARERKNEVKVPAATSLCCFFVGSKGSTYDILKEYTNIWKTALLVSLPVN